MSNLVTFEQAKILKNLGYNRSEKYFYFNDEPDSLYCNIPSDHNTLSRYDNKRYSAPIVSEALDFIRENYKDIAFEISVYLYSEGNLHSVEYEFVLYAFYDDDWNTVNDESYFDTYSIAENALLNAVLEYLEKGGSHV